MKRIGMGLGVVLSMVAGNALAESTPPTPAEPFPDPPGWVCEQVGERIVCVPVDHKKPH